MRTSGPNEFNYSRAFEIFVSIALLNIWGHQDQMSSTRAQLLRSLCSLICSIYEDIRTKCWDLWVHCFAKYMRTLGTNEFNYCRDFEIFVSIALLNMWGHHQQSFWDHCVHCFVQYMRTSGPNEFNYSRDFEIFVSIALLNMWGHHQQSFWDLCVHWFAQFMRTLEPKWDLCVHCFAKYTRTEKSVTSCDKARREGKNYWQFCSDLNGLEWRKLVSDWHGMLAVGFCWTWMAWNGGSRFCPDWNSFDWSKSVLA
jgi:hypothetical protein